jgi:hypothetical protein
VAGNVETDHCITIHVDNTAPSTSASLSGTAGSSGWWRSSVAVALSASDGAGIGVAGIRYRVDGGAWQDYGGPFTVTGDGAHTVEYHGTDYLGNAQAVQNLQIRIDTLPPVTRSAITGTLGLNGWYTDTVAVTLAAADATSGVDVVFLDGQAYTLPVTYTVDGRYDLPFYAIDVAGNQEEAAMLSFGLDTVPPAARIAGGAFCPGCGEVLLLQPAASDATSGLNAWRLDILAVGQAVASEQAVVGSQVVREWTGSTAPSSIPWDGRDADGKRVKKGNYTLQLWVQDGAGWTAVAAGWVKVKPKPSSPSPPAPLPTSTPMPIPTATLHPTSIPTSTPSPTLRPGETPQPTSTPAPTNTPVPEPTLDPVPVGVVLRVGVFRDDDANGLKELEEPGLVGLSIQVEGGTWSEAFVADAAGVVTITLPGAGTYEISLAGYPAGAAWEPTTRTAMQVRIGGDGSVVFLPAGETALPTGMAEGVAFAFGLVAVAPPSVAPVIVWPSHLLLGGVLIWLAQGTGRARIAAAIRERVDIEKRLVESQVDLGHTFIEED